MRLPTLALAALLLLTPAVARAGSCTEVSDVTGEEKCSRFGSRWSLEGTVPMFFQFGMRYSESTVDDLDFGASKTKGSSQSIPYQWRGRSLGFRSLNNVGISGGLGFFVWGQLYTGVESHLSFGHVTTRPTSVTARGQTLTLAQDDGVNASVYGAAAPIGYRIPLGRAALRAEVAVGFDVIEISHQVSVPNAVAWTGSAFAVRGIVEPRIGAEIWFTQHMAFGVIAGMNVVGNNADRSLGLTLAWHARALDGGTAF